MHFSKIFINVTPDPEYTKGAKEGYIAAVEGVIEMLRGTANNMEEQLKETQEDHK